MAIRTLNESTYDRIASKKDVSDDCFNISDQDFNYVYEKGINELEEISSTTKHYISFLAQAFCGADILGSEETVNFLTAIDVYTEKILPLILLGDLENLREYCNDEISDDKLNVIRQDMYRSLINRYLNK